MIDFIFIWIAATGHTNARISEFSIERFQSLPACEERLKRSIEKDYWKEGKGVCFPVGALPK